MFVLLLYRTAPRLLSAVQESLAAHGHTARLIRFERADRLHSLLSKTRFHAVVSSDVSALAYLNAAEREQTRVVFLSNAFYCSGRMDTAACDLYLIAHEALSFDFINNGAKDRLVHVCGIPLTKAYKSRITKETGCAALGLQMKQPIFLLLADGVSGNELKATVRTAKTLYPTVQILILSADKSRIVRLQSAFAQIGGVFAVDRTDNISLGFSVADVVFTAALAEPVCAAAQRGKSLILLHSALSEARKNAAFLDQHGVAFCGRTAADNASYACRLLESQRLRTLMTDAQEKYILSDADNRFVKLLEELSDFG